MSMKSRADLLREKEESYSEDMALGKKIAKCYISH